jgi:ABC-type branched-subunit amino acid transport system substrate-binding protein
MGEPLFTNTGSKIGSILLVIILTAAGGGLYLNQQSQIDFSGKIDLSTELQPDVEEPGWVGVGTGDLNFTEGAVIIVVADTAYPSSSGATTGDVVMQTLTDVVEEEVNEYCKKNGYMYRFDFVPYNMIVGDDGISGSIPAIKEMGVDLVVGYSTPLQSIGALDEIRENDLLYICPPLYTSRVTDILDGFYGIGTDIPEGEIFPKIFAEKGIEAIIVLQNDLGDKAEIGNYYTEKLYNGVAANFEAIGGTVYERIVYPYPSIVSSNMENNEDYTEYITAADEAIRNAKDEYGDDKVGVLAIGLSEVYVMLYQGQNMEHFLSVPWFGCEGTTSVRGQDEAGDIAVRIGLIAPRDTIWSKEKLSDLSEEVLGRMGSAGKHKEVYEKHALTYDACWLLALSVIEADSSEAADVESVFRAVSATYDGLNGNYALDEYGDKIQYKAEICRVVETPADVFWPYDLEVIGYYDVATGALTVHESFYENP